VPVHLRALVVVMTLSLLVLFLARRVACETAIRPDDFKRRAAVWVVVTLAAFLSHNYWLFALITVPLIALAGNKDSNRLALYFFLLFAIPPFLAMIPGLGVFGDALIELHHTRWLSLALLLPAYLSLRGKPGVQPLGAGAVDKFLLSYLLVLVVLQGLDTTVTNVLRILTGLCLDIILPYYVASRALRDLPAYRDALMSFVVAALIMCPIALAEYAMHWLMYAGLGDVLGLPFWGFGRTLNRGDLLRAQVTAGQPIVLGYFMAVALAFIAFLRPSVPNIRWWLLGVAALIAGLLASLSRGPWVGAVAMLMVLVLTGPNVMRKLGRTLLVALVLAPVLLMTPQGQAFIDYLPFVGTVEARNVEFRQRLLDVSLGVLANFPFFGALDFIDHPDMEQLRGNDGIIDVVNTYVRIALSTGLVGLTLFLAPFVGVGAGIARSLHAQQDKSSELHLLGRCLLAALVAIMVTLGTVSPILSVPVVYVVAIGLGVGYLRLVASTRAAQVSTQRADAVRGVPSPAGRGARLSGVRRKVVR